ncbi:polynucleotidyl transferase ribonuclease H fold, partial [Trifolium medium]|nr:polynucleotidyl transferase ribonuclease H fold [Trifolium medium]
IWKLKVPPKVKNLVWRMCRGCLPTRVRLQDKGVWRMAGLWDEEQAAVTSTNSAIDAIFSLLHDLSSELNQRMAAILWSVWKHRNLKLWQNESELCAQVVDRAKSLIDDWKKANTPSVNIGQQQRRETQRDSGHARQEVDMQLRWQKPMPGMTMVPLFSPKL